MASSRGIRLINALFCSSRAPSPFVAASLLRPYPRLPRTLQPAQAQVARRYVHQIPRPGRSLPPAGKEDDASSEAKSRKQLEPHYELTFTCIPCRSRSTHTISKQGYHKGSVLITCPSCRNRHIISDHLNIFGDRKLTVEDLMKEKGQLVKRGTLGVDGDVEFWEDGTQTERSSNGSTTTGNTKVTGELDSPTTHAEASTTRETCDPSPSATTSSATTSAASPLGGSGARPQLNDKPSTDIPPAMRRQIHTGGALRVAAQTEEPLFDLRSSPREGRRQRQIDELGIDKSQLSQLRWSLQRHSRDAGPKPRSNDLSFRKVAFPGEPPLRETPLMPSKIPKSHLAMLRHSMRRSMNSVGDETLTPISLCPAPLRKSAMSRSDGLDSNERTGPGLRPFHPPKPAPDGPRNVAPPPYDSNYINVFRRLKVGPSNLYTPNIRQTAARAQNLTRIPDTDRGESWAPAVTDDPNWSYQEREPDPASHTNRSSIEKRFQPLMSSSGDTSMNTWKIPDPTSSRVRLINTGPKFQAEHYDIPSDAVSPAESPRYLGNSAFIDRPDPSLQARMRRLPKGDDPSKQLTVYAWPEGAAEPVEVQIAVRGNLAQEHPKRMKGVSRPPGKPQFRKLIPKQKFGDKNAPISSDDFKAEMQRASVTPQRPLPEETYERITRDVEAAKDLPRQKVHLEDYDIYGEDTDDGPAYLV